VRILALDGSPSGGGRTATALAAVLAAAADAGADTALLSLCTPKETDAALDALAGSDAFVIGSPVYRASYAAPLKAFLDRLPRAMWGETTAPITGRAVAIICTGATWHHYLALNDLRNVLAGFFAAHVLSPGLYVPREGFADDALDDRHAALAASAGRALVELSRAIDASSALRLIAPQA
jgi:FMN reductase